MSEDRVEPPFSFKVTVAVGFDGTAVLISPLPQWLGDQILEDRSDVLNSAGWSGITESPGFWEYGVFVKGFYGEDGNAVYVTECRRAKRVIGKIQIKPKRGK